MRHQTRSVVVQTKADRVALHAGPTRCLLTPEDAAAIGRALLEASVEAAVVERDRIDRFVREVSRG